MRPSGTLTMPSAKQSANERIPFEHRLAEIRAMEQQNLTVSKPH